MSANIAGLLVRARGCDPEAVEALADLVEARLLRVSARPRGGDQRAVERAQRDGSAAAACKHSWAPIRRQSALHAIWLVA